MGAKKLFRTLALFAFLLGYSCVSSAQLVPQFTAIPLSGCAPLVVSFQDQTTGGAAQWRWDLGNGTISFLQNPSATYFTPGTYTVKLVVQTAGGTDIDSITKVNYITVFAAPAVAFTGSPLTGCFPLNVSFTDNSTPGSGTITSWLWDFGDGTSSTLQSPSHIYTNAGSFNVTLIVTGSNGCIRTLTKNNYIVIAAGINAAFTNSPASGCTVPETITFQNQSTGSGTLFYQWTFGDGGTSTAASPAHTYTAAGTYTVQLIVTNNTGCSDTVTLVNGIVIGTATADFTVPSPICAQAPGTFINTSAPTPVSVLWNFGDGTTSTVFSPIKTYAAAGTYTVTLISNFGGCQDTEIKTITVVAKPVSAFTGTPLVSCNTPLTVNFTNSSTGGTTTQWLFGDGGTSNASDPAYTYNAPGIYDVTLITSNASGCADTLVRIGYVRIEPIVASINNLPRNGCAPLTHTFTSNVTGTDPVVSYLWDFGDGTTSTAATPTHIFGVGDFDITLTIVTASGCTATVTVVQGIRAGLKPTANFMADPRDVCAEIPVAFQDLSTGTITNWLWLFGDGGQSTIQNPTHQYSDTGLFTVTLIVFNNGCSDTLVLTNYVHIKPPIAIFTVLSDCNTPYTRTFTDQSIGADSWLWDFGDGTTSTVQNPLHTYATVGSYNVTLTVFNVSTGCDYSLTNVVNIADEQALFTAAQTEICKNTAAVFTATSINAVSAITTYEWTFGDGTTGVANPVSHVYTTAGTYTVRLIITDVNGCKDTLVRNQYIKVFGPTADFNSAVPGSCLNTAVTFNNLSVSDGIHPIVQYHFYFGDGTDAVFTAPPFQHLYNAAGVYTVSLVTTDTYGCTDSIAKPNLLTISTPAALFASADTVSCPGKPVVFSNTSTGPGLTYLWNFGDGTTSTLATPTHAYTANGLYSVRLTVTDTYGCVSTLLKPQYISIVTPVADFTVNAIASNCPPLNVQFTNTSVNVASFLWNFGDGGTSQISNPSHIYNTPGTFNATLTVTSPGGCTSVKTQQIVIQGPTGTFSYTPLTGCNPLTVNFAVSSQPGVSFIYDFDDGTLLNTTVTSATHTYTIPGFYLPKVILKNSAGCNVPIIGLDTIRVTGVAAAFTADTLSRCDNGFVTFTNTSVTNDVITSYLWDFGDGTTSTDVMPVHFYTNTGIYTPTLTVTTQGGCSGQAIAQIPVRVVKSPDISSAQPPNRCAPANLSFSGSLNVPDTSAITWQWRFSDGQVFSGQNLPSVIFTIPGPYTDTLIATNSSGCMDTAVNTFEVYAKPNVAVGSDISICQGTGQVITATGADTYVWSPAAGLSCTNCPSPVATPAAATTYAVTGTSLQGCTNTDSIIVAVNFPIQIAPGFSDTICRGRSTVLTASGAASYVWSPATGLNTTTGSTVTATPDSTTTYMAVGSDSVNCFKDTAYYTVTVFPIPTIFAGPNQTINVGQSVTLTPVVSADVTNVTWTPSTYVVSTDLPAITVRPNLDIQYTARAVNAAGCASSSSVRIFVLCNGTNVFIPNTFSPNGDGANDVFYVRGTGLFTIKQLRIFNRWGEEIFEKYNVNANDVNSAWDGTFKGQKLPGDVYVYMIEVQCDNNATLLYKGNIALVR